MTVKITERLNGYRVEMNGQEFAVRNVVWNGIPVDVKHLELNASEVRFDENTMFVDT